MVVGQGWLISHLSTDSWKLGIHPVIPQEDGLCVPVGQDEAVWAETPGPALYRQHWLRQRTEILKENFRN